MSVEPVGAHAQSITAVTGATPMSMASPPPTPALDGTLKGIAQQLGMSVDGVQAALKQGRSITDLARQQGVSRSAIVESVQAQIQQRRRADGQWPIDQGVLDRLVNRALDHHRRPHRA